MYLKGWIWELTNCTSSQKKKLLKKQDLSRNFVFSQQHTIVNMAENKSQFLIFIPMYSPFLTESRIFHVTGFDQWEISKHDAHRGLKSAYKLKVPHGMWGLLFRGTAPELSFGGTLPKVP